MRRYLRQQPTFSAKCSGFGISSVGTTDYWIKGKVSIQVFNAEMRIKVEKSCVAFEDTIKHNSIIRMLFVQCPYDWGHHLLLIQFDKKDGSTIQKYMEHVDNGRNNLQNSLYEEGPYFVLYFEHDYEFARTCSFFNDSLPEIVHKVTEDVPPELLEVHHGRLNPSREVNEMGPHVTKTDEKDNLEDSADTAVTVVNNNSKRADIPFLVYPTGEGVTAFGQFVITDTDMARLENGQFLNDSIINFFFRFLSDIVNVQVQRDFHAFSTFFYAQVDAIRTQSDSLAQTTLKKLSKWSREVDLFSKKFLFFPVHKSAHWSLLVVCNPSSIVHAPLQAEKDRIFNVDALQDLCILGIDSLGCHDSKTMSQGIYRYLQHEWLVRYKDLRQIDQITCPLIKPKTPRQLNHYDCGVYVLLNAYVLLKRCTVISEVDVEKNIPQLHKHMYAPIEVNYFRDYLRQIMHTLRASGSQYSPNQLLFEYELSMLSSKE